MSSAMLPILGACTCAQDGEPDPGRPEAGGPRPNEEDWLSWTFAELRPPLDPVLAHAEAERCLECGGPGVPAPCTNACPAEIDVPAFVAAIARGEPGRAAEMIFAENLLGGSCARVCPTEELCEGACVLLKDGRRPVEVGRLQRFAADLALDEGAILRPLHVKDPKKRRRRVAVIGAGPSGLTCAGELAVRGYDVTVYDEHDEPGGLVRFAIAPYRQLRDPLPAEVEHLARLGVGFRLGCAIDSPEALRAVETEADAVFLGVGMGEDARLPLPGDELPGVWDSLAFIEAMKRGRRPRGGRHLAVIGGGNTAIDVAREAVRLAVRHVTLVYRRSEREMPAYRSEVRDAREEGVRFEWLTQPVRIVGRDSVQAIECRHLRLGPPDASGRPRPEPIEGSEFLLPVDTVVKAVGQRPRAAFLGWIDGLELDAGHIHVDPATGRTTNPKYWAGGDAVTGGATVVQAVRAAKIAARGIAAALAGDAP